MTQDGVNLAEDRQEPSAVDGWEYEEGLGVKVDGDETIDNVTIPE